jgi:hypothetical protein
LEEVEACRKRSKWGGTPGWWGTDRNMTGPNPHSQPASGWLHLAKYSFGVGDRFAHQAKAQLRGCMLAARPGLEIILVWNKSNRERSIVPSKIVGQLGKRYLDLLDACEQSIARNVTMNLYERHLKPILLAEQLSAAITSAAWTAAPAI